VSKRKHIIILEAVHAEDRLILHHTALCSDHFISSINQFYILHFTF